jgi:hypothetical protein
MTVENDFLAFATGVGANVLDQADYANLTSTAQGYASGVANSAQLNKTWRQSSFFAAAHAAAIAEVLTENVLDNGNLATLTAQIIALIDMRVQQSHGKCYLNLSAGSLLLTAQNGNGLSINGSSYQIPSGGIGLAPAGLIVNTFYYVYAFINGAGNMTLAASTTGFAYNGYGIAVKSTDSTQTLVGCAYCNDAGGGVPQFLGSGTNQNVASFFNSRTLPFGGARTAAATTSSTTAVELAVGAEVSFVSLGINATHLGCPGSASSGTGGDSTSVVIGIDSAAVTSFATTAVSAATNATVSHGPSIDFTFAAGYHVATPMGYVNAGTGTFNVSLTGFTLG